MKLAVRRTTTALAAFATAGVSSIFLGAAPAYAATEACGETGTLVGPGVCEQTFTSGTSTFTPTADMTKLEVLLVGAGGNGTTQNASGTTGYAAGGGGEVRIVDFSGATDPLEVTVPSPGIAGGVDDGTTNETVDNGANGTVDDETAVATGGESGNGNAGASVPMSADPEYASYGGGGGAGGAASGANGGAGVVVDTLASGGSLFDGDTRCFGGGGAVPALDEYGLPGCGGGAALEASEVAPTANSGGGAGASTNTVSSGASGFVAIRWSAANVTLTFDVDGRGTAPAPQSVPAGSAPTQPAEPTASGYEFDGWFTDEELTNAADFSAPLETSATFYAKWIQVLPATGGAPDVAHVSIGLGALALGMSLAAVAHIRKRKES